jgi:hypothetical protein
MGAADEQIIQGEVAGKSVDVTAAADAGRARS